MSYIAHAARHGITGPVLTVVAAGATLVMLSSCGDGGSGTRDEGVASLVTPSTTAGRTADPDAGHVRIRLDDNQQDINRLWDAWSHCLQEHGVPAGRKAPADSPALKTCESKYPLQPAEMDPASNPRYGDGVRAMVKCMNGHGIKSVVDDGNWGLVSGDSLNRPDYDKYRVECQVKSFGNGG
ncbi:hypothetical protein AB0I69_32580 [Streptomyces sp. NPDC050508]|uniref:hypothetical protein n=1 Tax=Streptomyces sp. NPDC050508 TaxID=3155405 RepID=UPI0034233D4F